MPPAEKKPQDKLFTLPTKHGTTKAIYERVGSCVNKIRADENVVDDVVYIVGVVRMQALTGRLYDTDDDMGHEAEHEHEGDEEKHQGRPSACGIK